MPFLLFGVYLRYLIRKGHEKYEIRVFLEGFRGILLQVEKHIDDIADITCAISHVHAARRRHISTFGRFVPKLFFAENCQKLCFE